MSAGLAEDFIAELFKISLKDRKVFEVACIHIKYQYLKDQYWKEIWKNMQIHYEATNKLITVGALSQIIEEKFSQQQKDKMSCFEVIAAIKKADTPDRDSVFIEIEKFVRNSMFLQLYNEIGDLYNKGDKKEAFVVLEKSSEEITNFTIRDKAFDRIFAGFHERNEKRLIENQLDDSDSNSMDKMPTGIPGIDSILRGGLSRGDTFLALAQSGIGKTKMLRHAGVTCARKGYKVVHIQAEGSRQECLDGYDASFTGIELHDMELGSVPKSKIKDIEGAINHVNGLGGEIFVEAYEKFDTASIVDVRNTVENLIKIHGSVDVLILDYFELFDPGDGKKYSAETERQRREAIGNKLKNIALEFNLAVFTATQASTVAPSLLNDPSFVQTRYNVSEFKGIVKPFSVFITMNQTKDEKDNDIMRLYMDKVRKYRGGQTIKICQRYDREKFYDHKRTIEEFE